MDSHQYVWCLRINPTQFKLGKDKFDANTSNILEQLTLKQSIQAYLFFQILYKI